MTSEQVLTILLACRDAERRAQLASLLDVAQYQWAQVEGELSPRIWDHVGLVICDSPLDAKPVTRWAEFKPLLQERRVGLIALGGPGPADADVVLPNDVSERELLNCIRLILDRVRLSRLVENLTQQQKSLVEQAMMDVVTGLPNRRAWEEQLARRIAALRAAGRNGCLAILDLDHFKRVNDERGHATGDEVLRAVGQTLRSRIRQADFAARLGGDEFGLIADGLTLDSATSVLERIRRDLVPNTSSRALPAVTASLGYILFAADSHATAAELFDAADRALGRAKAAGRDQSLEWQF